VDRLFVLLGIAFAFLAVALGAFGAHALQERLSAADAGIFETAVRYQMYHALALLFVGAAAVRWPGGATTIAGWLFVAGIVVFSGSLYTLVLSGVRAWGMVTPLGGLAFLAGWALLFWRLLRG
jgi:uncharacterized membrane protein YgdD (TMEM256/DUF423 family)